ncbi:hypothetical protein Tco_0758734, partial [Tanacetum coccineum]
AARPSRVAGQLLPRDPKPKLAARLELYADEEPSSKSSTTVLTMPHKPSLMPEEFFSIRPLTRHINCSKTEYYRKLIGLRISKLNFFKKPFPSWKFAVWMASKFSNHLTMDWYTKNELWMYWIRGDDEEVLIDKELSNLEETYINEEDEIIEIFRIETNIFDFETPLCKAFNEFNYLLKIDTDLLTHDIPGLKTYEELQKCMDP